MREKRESNLGGRYTFSKALLTGVLITVFSSIFTAIMTFVYVQFVDAERQRGIIEGTRQNLIASGASESQVAAQIASLQFIMSPLAMTFGAIILMMMVGVFFSLIGAAFVRKDSSI